jgi:hypothetical protein
VVVVVLDEAVLGATDTFTTEQGAGGETAEDLENGIVREAGQCVPLVGGLLHFVYVHTGIYNNKTEHMQKTKTSTENQPVPPPNSFHRHIIGLNRSPTLECFLYTSYSSKDQNSEANRKMRERRPADLICRLCRGTQRTRTPMPPRSTGKPHRLASKRTP